MARLPPCFSYLLSHIYRVNHRLDFYKRDDKPFISVLNPSDGKQSWLKDQNNLFEPIWQVESFFLRALVDIVDSVEQEHVQKRLLNSMILMIVLRRRKMLISQQTVGQATCA